MTATIIMLVRMYRLIPAPVRTIWSGGSSTSGRYLAELQSGNVTGFAAVKLIAKAVNPHMANPPGGPNWL